MNNDELMFLIGEIQESLVALNHIENLYNAYRQIFGDTDKRDLRDAVLLADILCNTYTCIECYFHVGCFITGKTHKVCIYKRPT